MSQALRPPVAQPSHFPQLASDTIQWTPILRPPIPFRITLPSSTTV